jgi:hypothetical protein
VVEFDDNCLFTTARTPSAAKADTRELRHYAMRRFSEVYAAARDDDRAAVDVAVRHPYALDLKAGWGGHVVHESSPEVSAADPEVTRSRHRR